MSDLDSEESAKQRRKKIGQGLKVLTQIKCLEDYQLL